MVSCILLFVFSRAQTDGPLTRGKCEGVLVQLMKPFLYLRMFLKTCLTKAAFI